MFTSLLLTFTVKICGLFDDFVLISSVLLLIVTCL